VTSLLKVTAAKKLVQSLAIVPRCMSRPGGVIPSFGAVPRVVGVSRRWSGSIPHPQNMNPNQLLWSWAAGASSFLAVTGAAHFAQ